MIKVPYWFICLNIAVSLIADILSNVFGEDEHSPLHNILLIVFISLLSIYVVAFYNKKIVCFFPVVSSVIVYSATIFYCYKVYDPTNITLKIIVPFNSLFYIKSYILCVGVICSISVTVYFIVRRKINKLK